MEKIKIGSIAKPQGIKGELKVNPLTSDISRFEKLSEIYLGDETTKRTIRGCKIACGNIFVFIDGIISRNDAEKIRGLSLFIDKDNAVELKKDEYFVADIIGCKIYNSEGEYLGNVMDILKHGAADIYEITGGKKKFMYPFVNGLTESVDIENKKIVLNTKRLEEVACYED